MSLSDLPESLNVRSPVKISSISVNNNCQDFKRRGSDGDGLNTTKDIVTDRLLDEVLTDLVNLKPMEDSEDKENENGDCNKARNLWTMAYRAIRKGSDDGDVFTPDKYNGVPRNNHDILADSPMLPARPERRETLGSLSDCFNQIKLEDERTGSPMIHSLQRRNVAKLVTEARDSSTSVSTPSDLPRIRAVSPPPPSKLEFSPASTKADGDHKRSLFESPAAGNSRFHLDFVPPASLLDLEVINSLCEQILMETMDELIPYTDTFKDQELLCDSNSAESNFDVDVQGLENQSTCTEDRDIVVESSIPEVHLEDILDLVVNRTEDVVPLKEDNLLDPQKQSLSVPESSEAAEEHPDPGAPMLKSPYKLIEEPAAPRLKMMSRHSSLKSLKSPSVSGGTPKSVKFCEAPPTKISPKPFEETKNEDDLDFLLKKIKSMRRPTEPEDTDVNNSSNAESSFALPSKLDLPDLSYDILEAASDCQTESIMDGNSINFNFPGEDEKETETSVLASHGGDFTLTCPKIDVNQTSRREISNEESTRTVLHHQSTLLTLDKQIAALGEDLLLKEAERVDIMQSINAVDERNVAMELVVEECERTITQIGFEKERELGIILESKEKAAAECDQAKEDLQAVDRALKDTSRRYERTKNQIGIMKDHENRQKEMVVTVQEKLKKEQERYEVLKADANEKLSKANGKLAEIQGSREAEILKLRSLLKKAELEVSSLDTKVGKLGRENEELTKICDELISKY